MLDTHNGPFQKLCLPMALHARWKVVTMDGWGRSFIVKSRFCCPYLLLQLKIPAEYEVQGFCPSPHHHPGKYIRGSPSDVPKSNQLTPAGSSSSPPSRGWGTPSPPAVSHPGKLPHQDTGHTGQTSGQCFPQSPHGTGTAPNPLQKRADCL